MPSNFPSAFNSQRISTVCPRTCVCVGDLAVHIAEAARKANPDFPVYYEKTRESLLEHLNDYVQKGDTILVKASHFMKFEEVVKALEEM